MLAALASAPVQAADHQRCVPAEIVLWGDGRHDDTKALNAWLRGENAIWGDSGAPVGAVIAGRSFRLSSAIYVRGGAGRELTNFRMLWPARGEIVTGGTIRSGGEPDRAPAVAGVSIEGGDPGEGKPFETPDVIASPPRSEENCATS